MSKKSHHFLTLWPWPLTYSLEKLIRSRHYHYQCVYQIWEQSIPWFLSYRVNTIAGGGRLRRKTITSPDPSDTGDITNKMLQIKHHQITAWIQNLRLITREIQAMSSISWEIIPKMMPKVGPISLKNLPSQFKFNGSLLLFSTNFLTQWSLHNKV